jgi:hypothetical protein
MPSWLAARLTPCRALPAALRRRGAAVAGRVLRALRRRRVRVEVLVADSARRRALDREVRGGLRRLEHVLGTPLPREAAILVQQVLPGERPLAGCFQTGLRPDGRRYARIRLALEVEGRPLSTDELLAILAEQCVGLADQENSRTVLVPVELPPAPPAGAGRPQPPRAFRPDPLAPDLAHPNGYAGPGGPARAA